MVDLRAAYEVLETEAARDGSGLRTKQAGLETPAGPVEAGVDVSGTRYLLIPLLAGEAALEDRGGRSVQLRRTRLDGVDFLALTCSAPRLHRLFLLLAEDILGEVAGSRSPAAVVYAALQRWKELLAAASGPLGDSQIIGLMAELLIVELCVGLNPSFDIDHWTGPAGGKHDLQAGDLGVEVKATTVREGRVVQISSIEQLAPDPGSDLFLALHRFEPVEEGAGETLPAVIDRLIASGVAASQLHHQLDQVGYSDVDREHYESRVFRLVDRRTYDCAGSGFPKLTPSSFGGAAVPPGVLRIRYSIDLTNEPPVPLSESEALDLWSRLARGADGST